MKVLLDTHALLWWLLGNPRPNTAAAAVLGRAENRIVGSAVSGHEIATKHRLGKLPVPARLAEHLDDMVAENGWEALPVGGSGTDRRRPALVTNDPAFVGFGVKVIW